DARDPVKPIFPTPGCAVSRSPISDGRPVTRLSKPGGRTFAASSTDWIRASGQVSGGFTTTAFPASKALTIWEKASELGEFHGTIDTTTPNGRRAMRVLPLGSGIS